MIRALDRKLLRDLWRVRSMALAISVVVAAGIALLVASLICFDSLESTRDRYYAQTEFADVFAGTKRAPRWLAESFEELPGVEKVSTRVVVGVTLDVPGMTEPVNGRLISVPDTGRPVLNNVVLRSGRWPDPGRGEEALVNERFAKAHGLALGDEVAAVINGRRQPLEIVGTVLSPEYVYAISGGDLFPDPKRFGLFWLTRRHLATAFDMEGGFNDISLSLAEGASAAPAIAELDRLIEPYGGLGAIPRALQVSNWYLQNEITGLRGMAVVLPTIFLGIAAFLLNVVLRRLIAVQREQIAVLKAIGYSNLRLGLHYIQWAVLVSVIGGALGIGLGALMSGGMLSLYLEYYTFPALVAHWNWSSLLATLLACGAAAVLGAAAAVRSVVRLPPAEAMRPAAPEKFRVSLLERLGLRRFLSQPLRMVLRNLSRRPLRAAMSIVGIAFSAAITVMASASMDSFAELMEIQFNVVQRQDVTVTFVEPEGRAAYYELASVPGVLEVEATNGAAVRLRNGSRQRQVAIQAFQADARLQRVVGSDYRPVQFDRAGLVLSRKLAEVLDVTPGEMIRVEALQGTRPVADMAVGGLVDDLMGMSAYLEPDALQRFLGDTANMSGAALGIDPAQREEVYQALKGMPVVAGVALRHAMLENFDTFVAENMNSTMAINLLFALIIAFGVIYNTARISLSESSRELASMRVMGFTRSEIGVVLFGELGILTAVAIPVGLGLGYSMLAGMLAVFETELFRLPMVAEASTFALASGAVVVAMGLSLFVVRRKLNGLDLVEVLKTRE